MFKALLDWAFPFDAAIGWRAPSWALNGLLEVACAGGAGSIILSVLGVPDLIAYLACFAIGFFWPKPGLGERWAKRRIFKKVKAALEALGPPHPVTPDEVLKAWINASFTRCGTQKATPGWFCTRDVGHPGPARRYWLPISSWDVVSTESRKAMSSPPWLANLRRAMLNS
jgi:hypothetical protein